MMKDTTKTITMHFSWKKSYAWPLALGLTLLAAFAFMALYGVRYDVNDDAIISNIAAGAYGTQTEYLVYVNLLVGILLKPFYFFAPTLNWFVLLLLAGGIFCFAQLGVLLLKNAGPVAGGLLFACLLLCAGGEFFVYFHYVRYAGLFLTTGLILMALHMGRWCPPLVLGLALALLGSMVRFQMFMAVGALGAALLLWRFWALPRAQKKQAVAAGAVLVLGVCLLWGINQLAYKTQPGWAAYLRYNDVRTDISDFRFQFAPNWDTYEESFGYSATDMEMVDNWTYYDNTVFPVEKLEAFRDVLPTSSPVLALKTFLYTATQMLYSTPCYLLFGVCFVGWLTLGRRKRWPIICTTCGVLFAEVLFLCWRGRLPERIGFTLVLATLCFSAVAFLGETAQKDGHPTASPFLPKKQAAAFLLATLCLACLPSFLQQAAEMDDYHASRPPRAAEFDTLSQDKEHLYLLDSYLVDAANGFDVWRPRGKDYFSNLFFLGSWLMESPFQTETLQRYGLKNPYQDSIGNEQVLLADYYYRQIKENYLRRHYDETAQVLLAEEYNDFNLYQITAG